MARISQSTSVSRTRENSTTSFEATPFSGSPGEVGVELVEMSPPAKERRATIEAHQPAKSMCFLKEDCKWCSHDNDVRSKQTGNHPSDAVVALRQCLAVLERDRRAAEERRVGFLALMARFLSRCDGIV
ncbi:hypothetical protein J7T55_000289 [Diaporthe amygdali]|uniref:uncharacterized protein n=1 Tax=Phomopsis amygdali TaxID=1214568 RepID=UPI0022FF3E40|nr:uncharacterized protein J7T55_000289 [Diaporthe amygdali]KAJ0109364.1 hypothetical protein J7T55_000289 [Diaporthe amygdali]